VVVPSVSLVLVHEVRAMSCRIFHRFGCFLGIAVVTTAAHGSPPPLQVSRKAGQPRHWHAGQTVSKESSVNVRNGNLVSVIPVCQGMTGTGPAIEFTIYANHLSTVSGITIPNPTSGINLGTCFTHTYKTQLVFASPTVTQLLEDDGTFFNFTWNSGAGTWNPPAGYTQTLVQQGAEWRVTYKDQSYRRYSDVGRLLAVGDASGNETAVTYQTVGPDTRILNVTSAAGNRKIEFIYSLQTGRLESIKAPRDAGTPPTYRYWSFYYDANGWLERVDDPMDYESGDPNDYYVKFTFDSAGRIKKVSDANGFFSEVVYDLNGLVASVKDPAPFTSQVQSFAYEPDAQQPAFNRTYADRRGGQTTYKFYTNDNNLIELKDPLNHTNSWAYNATHDKTSYTNALGKTWYYTWDSKANRLTETNPIGQMTAWTFNSLNQLTSITPPLNNMGGTDPDKKVEFFYTDTINPTKLTAIHEPSTPPGGPPAITTMTHYGAVGDHPEWKGLRKELVDPNGVSTRFTYDAYGQPDTMEEGPITSSGGPVAENYDYNAACWATGGGGGFGGGAVAYNANALVINQSECFFLSGPPAVPLWPAFPATCTNPDDTLDFRTTAGSWAYDTAGRLTSVNFTLKDSSVVPNETSIRNRTYAYDSLDRPTQVILTSDEPTWDAPGSPDVVRTFEYYPNWVHGTDDFTGPDGQLVEVDLDLARRITSLTRSGNTISYGYDNASRLTSIDYPNATQVLYQYDDADRVTQIHHTIVAGQTILKLDYVYKSDGLVSTITEYDNIGYLATTTFNYDNRNRLTRELRSGSNPYDVSYTYDAGSNRLTKVDGVNGLTTYYTYDIADQSYYGSRNNRLMWYEIRNSVNQVVETVWYGYHKGGHVQQIVRKPSSGTTYYRTFFLYDRAGRLWIAVKDQWTNTGTGPTSCTRTWAREFRYDTGRARYLARSRDPANLSPTGTATWTDYNGSNVHQDYNINKTTGVVTEVLRHVPGKWQEEVSSGSDTYFHGDVIGTTRRLTNGQGSVGRRTVYTAFGELVFADGQLGSRYGYGGEWGYEGDAIGAGTNSLWGNPTDGLALLHVGERYYDPSTGRFIMRDPAGLQGGANTYTYANNTPTIAADPKGEIAWFAVIIIAALIVDATADYAWAPDPQVTSDQIAAVNRAHEKTKVINVACVVVGALIPGGKAFTPDQQALIELAKGAQRTGVTRREAATLLRWGREYNVRPLHSHTQVPNHWVGGPHIRIGPVNHIPVQ